MNTDNKNSCFRIKFVFKETTYNQNLSTEQLLLNLEERLDLVLTNVGATEETYKIYDKTTKNSIEVLFKVKTRKRIGVITNTIKKIIKPKLDSEIELLNNYDEELIYHKNKLNHPYLESCNAFSKKIFDDRLQIVMNDYTKYFVKSESKLYDGKDIAVFNDKSKHYSWQKTIADLIFHPHGGFKEAHDREIIFIEDTIGNSGKSSFFKYWYTKFGDEIGILSEATASQLRSNIIKLGKRKLYIIDLPRTESELGVKDLINAVEVLKGGFLNSSFFGRADTLVMNPPHIIVAGNYLPSGAISPDRWKVLTLIKDNNGKDIFCKDTSKEKQNQAKKEIERKMKEKFLEAQIEEFNIKLLEKKLTKLKANLKS
jgi:hypothetical protein